MYSVQQLRVLRNGNATVLTDDPYILYGISGQGLVEPERSAESGPYQHGATDTGFVLPARTLALSMGVQSQDYIEFEQRSRELYKIFGSRRRPVTLEATLWSGAVREIECHYAGGLAGDSASTSGFLQKHAVALNCPNPIWHDPAQETVKFQLGIAGGRFYVPTEIPTGVGTSTMDSTQSINYAGDWEAYPVITIYGPVTGLVIDHVELGDKIAFKTGLGPATGEIYEIDCRANYKVVRRTNDNTLHTGELTDDSQLATFRLASEDDAPGGINSIRVRGTGATEVTAVFVSWRTAYQGI